MNKVKVRRTVSLTGFCGRLQEKKGKLDSPLSDFVSYRTAQADSCTSKGKPCQLPYIASLVSDSTFPWILLL